MKRRLGHRVIGAVAVAGAVGFLTGCGPEQPWDNALVSTNAAGTDTMSFAGQIESISPDATKVVFSSYSTDLVTQPVHGAGDVYLRDVAAGTTTLISANAAGTADGNSSSGGGTLSPDGTKV